MYNTDKETEIQACRILTSDGSLPKCPPEPGKEPKAGHPIQVFHMCDKNQSLELFLQFYQFQLADSWSQERNTAQN